MLMGQRRQQGLGNVITGLLGGMDVLLSEASPIFQFLQERGACVRGLSSLPDVSLDRAVPDAAAREANRRIVDSFWGEDAVLRNIATLLADAQKLVAPSVDQNSKE